ncbi:hypothetical protein GCM10022402_24050 [Salinactinospora qingdaonensis]|uniref:Uncharacterized protein n=1 Tax=Salinactinospora qingdaonensis TaxID=702744 RepID=A0ABP7FMD2_9ACTN
MLSLKVGKGPGGLGPGPAEQGTDYGDRESDHGDAKPGLQAGGLAGTNGRKPEDVPTDGRQDNGYDIDDAKGIGLAGSVLSHCGDADLRIVVESP